LAKDKDFYSVELKKFNTHLDPSGLTLDVIRTKLQKEDPSAFRKAMDDLNYIGEEPTWEIMELRDRVTQEHHDGTEAG
jgi:hypothetical protein